jgi:hypothetical protein
MVVCSLYSHYPKGHGMAWAPLFGSGHRSVGPAWFSIFPIYPKWLNFKNSKWVPYLATKIPNFCTWLAWDITNNFLNCANIQFTTFESLMNFKKDSNLLEKSDKFSKIPSWLDLHKSEFSWDQLYKRIWITIQVPNGMVWIWNSNLTTFLCRTQSCKDFVQASKIHSELPFSHCSYYCNTRSDTRVESALPILKPFSIRKSLRHSYHALGACLSP